MEMIPKTGITHVDFYDIKKKKKTTISLTIFSELPTAAHLHIYTYKDKPGLHMLIVMTNLG